MRNGRSLLSLTLVSVLALAQADSAAQSPAAPGPRPGGDRDIEVAIVHGPDDPAFGFMPPLDAAADLDVLATIGVGGAPATGAPYSADAVTEVVQTLVDGNRIVRQSRSAVARDGSGRTRREQGLSILGGAVADDEGKRIVQIHDPVAGAMYVLDLEARTAHRMPAPTLRITRSGADGSTHTRTFSTFELPALPLGPPAAPGAGGVPAHDVVFMRRGGLDAGAGPANVESLGTRTIEGVDAEGTRTTTTIPAGRIGNERPIEIVSERWYSPALKVLVSSRRFDPRFGETTYRLTNVVQAEPAPELFQVPPDVRVVDGGRGIRIERRLERQRKAR